MDELTTERTLICKLRGSFMRLAYLFDMLAICVCATRHFQAPGRLGQELNVCTVEHEYSIIERYEYIITKLISRQFPFCAGAAPMPERSSDVAKVPTVSRNDFVRVLF